LDADAKRPSEGGSWVAVTGSTANVGGIPGSRGNGGVIKCRKVQVTGDFWGFLGISGDFWPLLQIEEVLLASGKHTKNDGKIHHAINGKTHYFYGHFPVCKL